MLVSLDFSFSFSFSFTFSFSFSFTFSFTFTFSFSFSFSFTFTFSFSSKDEFPLGKSLSPFNESFSSSCKFIFSCISSSIHAVSLPPDAPFSSLFCVTLFKLSFLSDGNTKGIFDFIDFFFIPSSFTFFCSNGFGIILTACCF
ncbi:hypothetical protein EHP00_2581 [Ecytonucleospora hepatopenaei]|uniref:Uncharacterized protein n=1 Tax=Ecytonucleospora hepatopenaei TaxID=646526 RepID=A0A1W0E875_9MICR|nr:hypothetical protein EHP00_2581 [Ecytonucleospora hepatopenaei]